MDIWVCYSGEVRVFTISLRELRSDPEIYNWHFISCWNNLSIEFIVEFADKINFEILIQNKYITDEVKEFCRMFI